MAKSDSKLPKTPKGQARADAILVAAKQLLTEHGYGEMTMRQVADKVGISLSNVQHYFPSREDLLKAVLTSVMESYDPAFAGALSADISPREKLVAVLRYLLADIKNPDTEKLFVEIWSMATRQPSAREIFDLMYTHHRKNLATFIAASNPTLPERHVQLRAALVAMQIEGLMLLISDSKPKHAELEGIEDECIASMLRVIDAPA